MSEQYKPGDRVKVTIEGVVRSHDSYGNAMPHVLQFQNAHGNASHRIYTNQDDVKVERLEPPVETFGPGDTVRSKNTNSAPYTLGKDGYFDHLYNEYYKSDFKFTSKNFERVSLG